MGNILFKYIYEELKSSYGLVIDKEERIFVNGKYLRSNIKVYILLAFVWIPDKDITTIYINNFKNCRILYVLVIKSMIMQLNEFFITLLSSKNENASCSL